MLHSLAPAGEDAVEADKEKFSLEIISARLGQEINRGVFAKCVVLFFLFFFTICNWRFQNFPLFPFLVHQHVQNWLHVRPPSLRLHFVVLDSILVSCMPQLQSASIRSTISPVQFAVPTSAWHLPIQPDWVFSESGGHPMRRNGRQIVMLTRANDWFGALPIWQEP